MRKALAVVVLGTLFIIAALFAGASRAQTDAGTPDAGVVEDQFWGIKRDNPGVPQQFPEPRFTHMIKRDSVLVLGYGDTLIPFIAMNFGYDKNRLVHTTTIYFPREPSVVTEACRSVFQGFVEQFKRFPDASTSSGSMWKTSDTTIAFYCTKQGPIVDKLSSLWLASHPGYIPHQTVDLNDVIMLGRKIDKLNHPEVDAGPPPTKNNPTTVK